MTFNTSHTMQKWRPTSKNNGNVHTKGDLVKIIGCHPLKVQKRDRSAYRIRE